MKKLFLYYSQSGNGDTVAEALIRQGYDVRKVTPKKKPPKAFFLQILAGGFGAGIGRREPLNEYDRDVSDYDTVAIGSPVWNGRLSCPINTVLAETDLKDKAPVFVLYSGSGEAPKAEAKIREQFSGARIVHLKEPKSHPDELNKLNTLFAEVLVLQLTTEHLIIRPHTEADFEDYFRYIMDPELQTMLGLNGVVDRETALQTFRWLIRNTKFFALIDRSEGNAIGHICLHPPLSSVSEDPVFSGKTGYSLSFAIAKDRRRKGYMEEALRALIDALFESGAADYLDCEFTRDNIASGALQRKLGFAYRNVESFDGIDLVVNVLKREP